MSRDAIAGYQHLEFWSIQKDESLELEPFWIATEHGPPLHLLEQFASRLARAHGAACGEPICGWGSWGHWLERIDVGLMHEMVLALDGISSLRDSVGIVQIDDGWSEMLDSGRVSASWRPNRRFPSGIAPLAAEINRSGRECGLWLLPFTVNAGSHIVTQHPEWLVADGTGAPCRVGGADTFCLDPTHPGAAAWLREVFERIRSWGVRYVKLDHLRALLSPDPDVIGEGFDVRRRYYGVRTRVEAYRAGLQLIRDVLGDEATIVACSAPAAAGAGLVDAHRAGPDIEPHWVGHAAGIRDACRSLIANWFWQGRTWANDPDYVLACDTETHTRFWATVVALSGGSSVLSVDFVELRPWMERILSFVIPPIGISARPLDLFEHAPDPTLLHLKLEREGEQWHMLGVLNWGDRPREHEIDLSRIGATGPVHVWDAWRRTHRIAEGALRVQLEAHDAALFRITPVAHCPQLIGSDVHWAQGWLETTRPLWHDESHMLTVASPPGAPRAGSLWIWSPTSLQISGGSGLTESGISCHHVQPGTSISLRFSNSGS